jgi:6-phospho-beta-glucosidase
MKTVFFGGGSHRLISILRGALAQKGVFDNGHIHLHDLDVTRAEAVGRIVRQAPEFKGKGCKLTWGNNLDRALEGADAVAVILMAGSPLSYAMGRVYSQKWGFISSDNVSPNGALLGVKGAPILLDLARRMEKKCPNAWLLDFANPVAVLSAMVSRHTKIKALGVCQGFTNHFWDISRIFGKDELNPRIDVEAAGINHLSFVVRGRYEGKELFSYLDDHLAGKWTFPKLSPHWSERSQQNIRRSVTKLVKFYRELGVLIFSTEGDGMMHLEYEDAVAENVREQKGTKLTKAKIEARLRQNRDGRLAANAQVSEIAASNLDEAFWATQGPGTLCARAADDVFLRALRGISGVEKVKLVTSYLNDGAIANLPVGVACEYSQILHKQTIKARGRYMVPDIVQGITSSLATHQTMLADACATGDPKLLAYALMAYPMRPFSKAAKGLFKDLIALNREEMAPSLRTADQYL